MIGLALQTFRVFPNPDGAIDNAGERQHYLYLYEGIAAGDAVVANQDTFFHWRRGNFR